MNIPTMGLYLKVEDAAKKYCNIYWFLIDIFYNFYKPDNNRRGNNNPFFYRPPRVNCLNNFKIISIFIRLTKIIHLTFHNHYSRSFQLNLYLGWSFPLKFVVNSSLSFFKQVFIFKSSGPLLNLVHSIQNPFHKIVFKNYLWR